MMVEKAFSGDVGIGELAVRTIADTEEALEGAIADLSTKELWPLKLL